jgi:hypothetical protein
MLSMLHHGLDVQKIEMSLRHELNSNPPFTSIAHGQLFEHSHKSITCRLSIGCATADSSQGSEYPFTGRSKEVAPNQPRLIAGSGAYHWCVYNVPKESSNQ